MSDENTTTDQGGESSEIAVTDLVGPGKKFETLEALAKSKLEADNFIETLKQENADLRKTTDEKLTIKDLMDAFRKTNEQKPEQLTELTDDVLQERFETLIKEREASNTKAANRSEATKLVLPKVNNDSEAVNEFVKEKAKDLGMNSDALWELSETSPTAFARILGLDQTRGSTGSPNSLPHQNTEATGGGPSMEVDGFKTKAWYDAQRREMGNRKFMANRKMQLGILESREKLGERFYS